jgi:hypothetical protein
MATIIGTAGFLQAIETDSINIAGQKIYKLVYYTVDDIEIAEYLDKAQLKTRGDKIKLLADAIKAIPK